MLPQAALTSRVARIFTLIMAACVCGLAQNATLSLSSTSGAPGAVVPLNVSLAGTGPLPVSTQWNLSYSPTDFTSANVVVGSAAASKSLSCQYGTGTAICMLWGLNDTSMTTGVVATVSLTLSASTKSTSSVVQLTNGISASTTATADSTSTSNGTVTIVQTPSLNGFSCNPTSVSPSAGTTCTVELTLAAGSGGTTINLSSSPTDVTVQSTVTVPQGSTSTTFPVTAGSVTTPTPVTLTASLGGVNETFGLTVNPPPAALSAVSVAPTTIVSGQSGTGTVTLTSAAPSGGAVVSLSSPSAAASVPAAVTVAQGAISATFSVTAGSVATATPVTLTATYAGVNKTVSITVNPPSAALSSISVSPSTIVSGQSGTGTVTLTAAAPSGGAVVSLSSPNAAASLPASVTVAQGATSATFSVTAGTVTRATSVTLTASYSGVNTTFDLTVNPPAAALSSVSVSPSTIVSGQSGTGTVTLTAAAAIGGVLVTLSSSNTSAATVPASVTVASGATSVTFTVTAGGVSVSTPVTLTATYSGVNATFGLTINPASAPASGTAAFVDQDSTTQGTWQGVYGADGYVVIGDLTSNPSYVTPVASGEGQAVWPNSPTDIRALQEASNPANRIAGVWYSSTSFSVDLNVTDSNTHQVALYCLDWDRLGRSETVAITDANGNVLNSQSVTNFGGGVYLVWNVSGHVKIQVTLTGGANAVATGLFFGGGTTVNPPPAALSSVSVSPGTIVTGQSGTGTVTLTGAAPSGGALVTLSSSNSSAAGVPGSVTVSQGQTSATFTVTAGGVSVSTPVTLTARYSGVNATFALTINPASAPASGTAAFVKQDSTTQGSWQGVYGADGYVVIGDLTSNPSYVTPTESGAGQAVWPSSSTDIRDLQMASDPANRIAGVWYTYSSFTVDLNVTDGNTHQVALYCLDWDRLGRGETVAITDANGNVLNSQSLTNFGGGVYLVWNVSGHVKIQVTLTGGPNAVATGLFFH